MTGKTDAPRISHFGHACVLVESRGCRVLIDPGSFSRLPEDLGRVDAVAITHGHDDHVSADLVADVLRGNPDAVVVAPASVGLEAVPLDRVRRVAPGDAIAIAGVEVAVLGGVHARIHADIPQIENVGFLFVDDAILHPGDEFVVPEGEVAVLCAPISGPWQSLEDVVDYVRAVRPAVAVPVHEGMLARPRIYIDYLERLSPEGTTVVALEPSVPTPIA